MTTLHYWEAMRTMLHGANLPNKFWPYAFHYHIFISNSVPHSNQDTSPLEQAMGTVPDLSYLCTFGCQVTSLPPCSRHSDKLNNAPQKGVFLGFSRTGKNALYHDTTTDAVKITADIAFNEAEVGFHDLSPNRSGSL